MRRRKLILPNSCTWCARLANVQLINTVGVLEADMQPCTECWCNATDIADKGSLWCCKQCPSINATNPTTDYHLEYNITYRYATYFNFTACPKTLSDAKTSTETWPRPTSRYNLWAMMSPTAALSMTSRTRSALSPCTPSSMRSWPTNYARSSTPSTSPVAPPTSTAVRALYALIICVQHFKDNPPHDRPYNDVIRSLACRRPVH